MRRVTHLMASVALAPLVDAATAAFERGETRRRQEDAVRYTVMRDAANTASKAIVAGARR